VLRGVRVDGGENEVFTCSGCLKAVWLEIFGPVFPGSSAEAEPRDPPLIAGARPAHQSPRKISPADQFQGQFALPEKSRPSGTQILDFGSQVRQALPLEGSLKVD